MKHRYASKSSLFLMELLIAITVFALTSAICMQIFTYAKIKSDFAGDLSTAITSAQNVAECYKAYHGDLKSVTTALNIEYSGESDGFTYDIDENMALTLEPAGSHACTIRVIYQPEVERLYVNDENELKKVDEIYSLKVNTYSAEVN